MSNKGLLVIIAIILMGIFTMLAIQFTTKSPAEKFAENISETIEASVKE